MPAKQGLSKSDASFTVDERVLLVRDPSDPNGPVLRWLAVRTEMNSKLIYLKCHFFNQMDSHHRSVTYDGEHRSEWSLTSSKLESTLQIAGRTSSGDFVIPDNYRGFRIGGWLMTQTIRWAKTWPDANVQTILLSATDAQDENRERRNRLWISCGFRFTEDNPTTARSIPMRSKELLYPDKWRSNISEITLDRYHENVSREVKLLDQEIETAFHSFQDLDCRIEWLGKHSLRYALARLWPLSYNIPQRAPDYRPEEVKDALPSVLPSTALDTLLLVFPILRNRQDRLAHLNEMNDHYMHAIEAIETAPFKHLLGQLKDTMACKLAIAGFAIAIILYLNM